MFNEINKRAARIRQAPNGRPHVKTNGQRVNLESRHSYTSLNDGRTYWINGDRVKILQNYI